jgi:hypothetical protein
MWWARLLNNISGFLGGALPPVGDYESIETHVVGSGGTSSISFTTIPSTYKHLQIRAIARMSSSAENMSLRFNGDSGNNYNSHFIEASGSGTPVCGNGTGSGIQNRIFTAVYVADANIFSAQIIDILDYSNTNKYKTVRNLSGADRNGLSTWLNFSSGLWMNSAAISTITFTNNFAQYSHFALYGIKG